MKKAENKEIKAAIFAIDRLRMGTDGPGITTLVAFMGCPLRCKYCINAQCHEPIYEADGKTLRPGIMMLTPQQLYDKVKIDNIYFQATGGGICFGGGEPGLQAEFIEEFRKICGNKWQITIETSLCLDPGIVEWLDGSVDNWIIDFKTLHDDIFKKYTETNLGYLRFNLTLLRHIRGNVTIKVPEIPGYTTEESIKITIANLERFRLTNIKRIKYIPKIARYSELIEPTKP